MFHAWRLSQLVHEVDGVLHIRIVFRVAGQVEARGHDQAVPVDLLGQGAADDVGSDVDVPGVELEDAVQADQLEAAAHLTGNTGYPLVLILSFLLPLSITEHTSFNGLWHLFIFALCTLSVIVFYDKSQSALGRSFKARWFDVLSAMSLGIGMCVSQTRAVVEGLFQKTGEFVRTPKRGDLPVQGTKPKRTYRAVLRGIPGFELLFAGWFAYAVLRAFELSAWGSLPFLLLFLWGFAWVGGLSLQDWWRDVRRQA